MKVYAIDLDGTLISKNNKPILKNIKKVNKLFEDRNNLIIIYTARSESIRKQTKNLLNKLNIKYHILQMEKLRADIYIDDKVIKW
ncbi:MAG: HAD hydrolase family protein [Candidatus Aenigmatarchaeota archaeon]